MLDSFYKLKEIIMNKTLKNFFAIFGFIIGVCVFASAIAAHSPTPRLRPTEDPTITAEYDAPVVWTRLNLGSVRTGKAHVKRVNSGDVSVRESDKSNEDISAAIEREAAQISANIVGAQVEMSERLSTAKEYRPVMSHHVRVSNPRMVVGEIKIESHPSYVK
jgi:hypothetical protein